MKKLHLLLLMFVVSIVSYAQNVTRTIVHGPQDRACSPIPTRNGIAITPQIKALPMTEAQRRQFIQVNNQNQNSFSGGSNFTAACTDVIVDGGFETGGIPNTFWNPETSTNFGTPLCDVPSCGTGGGASPPRTGAFWLWFGGIPAPETATLGQTVTIAAGSTATLTFWMRAGTVSSPFTDVVRVKVDGVTQVTYTEPSVAEGAYTQRTVNLNAFANGAAHAILFEYVGTTSGTASFVIDDVKLDVCTANTADLSIVKTDGATTYTPGGTTTYTITAANAGPDAVTGATVADNFPAAITSVNWTAVYTGGATGPASGSGNINATTVNIPVGGTAVFTAVCNISAGATGNLVNTATITAPVGTTDGNAANNSSTDTDAQISADLAITKTDGVTTYIAGGTTTYTITASNAGPQTATGATVTDLFPAAITGVTWTAAYAGGATGPASGTGNISATVNIPSGGSVTFTAVCTISGAATGTISNTATVAGPAGLSDPNPANNSATDSDTQASVDLTITKTDGVTFYTPGGTVTYTIVATNNGPQTATGANISDAFPAQVSSASWTAVYAGGATGTASGVGNININVNMPSGGSVTITATCNISAVALGSMSNTAIITPPSGVNENVPANNSATDTDSQASADLTITKTDGVTTYLAGNSVTYTIAVGNAGPQGVTGATVTDNFPAQITGITWTAAYGGGATGPASGTGNINATVNIPSGGTATFTAVCTISGAATGSMVNTATVAGPAGVTDPNPANNSATDTDTQGATGCIENFDGVTVPNLPAGWTASTGATCGTSTVWQTVITPVSSAPNAAFSNDPSCVSDEYLDSRIYAIDAAPTQLTFQNYYNLEASGVTPTLAFDGMALEISIAAGPFTDILTAGGTFVTGGYNRTVSPTFSSPMINRQVWSGNSGGYITTTVNLPAAAQGQSVRFRWRRATDNSATAAGIAGAAIDDVQVITTPVATISYAGSPYCSNAGTATVTQTGTTGGSYSSTAGLTINAATGAITLGTSTAGTYTVTYTVTANGGCQTLATTASVTITAAPSATISYAGSPYCQNGGTATVTRTGTAGGTYSSTAGLTLNAANGDVTLGTSTPGTYTVTYTVAAAGGCAVYTTTGSITITATPSATISYAGSPYCQNAGTATVTQTGTAGGTYSSTAGLTINAGTGTVTLGTSTAGTYTVTYTVAAAGGCAVYTTTASITITATPSATITYAGSPYCQNAGTATVTRTGTAGGTYSSTAGLTINAANGDVTLGTSTAGTYTVTYTVAAAGGCAVYTTTTTITITTPPSATIAYTGSPYCSNAGTATVTRTGTAGGTYSSTAGLSINAATGAITLGTSTAGTYTVTYTVAAAGGCAVYTTTASVTITAAPNATITYAGSPYCQNAGTANVTRTGTAGGTYSSTAGLTINAATGAVTLGTSTPGTYTVTYTVAAAGGCAVYTTTTTITITAPPSATIAYTGSPYCQSGGTATVTRTGTAGGTYSSTAGLTINAATGDVTLGTSTPGTYTVTYTVAAAGGCPVFTTTASITITPTPSATIAYAGSPYCQNAGTANVTQTGTAGGTYSSTAGLTINAATGAVTLGTSTPGTYTVTYTVPAGGGCAVYTTTTTITVLSLSVAPTGATASSPILCGPATVTLTAVGGTLGAGASYKWYSGSCGGTLVGTGAVLTNIFVFSTTTFFVRIEGTCNNTTCASVTVTVAPQPAVVLTAVQSGNNLPPQTLYATVSPVGIYSYVWKRDGVIIPNSSDTLHIGAFPSASYTVTVTSSFGCVATSNTIIILDNPSTTVFVSPNPNHGQFKVSYYATPQEMGSTRKLMIYDGKGSRIYERSYVVTLPYNVMDVDLSGIDARGVYFIALADGSGKIIASTKVMIQK